MRVPALLLTLMVLLSSVGMAYGLDTKTRKRCPKGGCENFWHDARALNKAMQTWTRDVIEVPETWAEVSVPWYLACLEPGEPPRKTANDLELHRQELALKELEAYFRNKVTREKKATKQWVNMAIRQFPDLNKRRFYDLLPPIDWSRMKKIPHNVEGPYAPPDQWKIYFRDGGKVLTKDPTLTEENKRLKESYESRQMRKFAHEKTKIDAVVSLSPNGTSQALRHDNSTNMSTSSPKTITASPGGRNRTVQHEADSEASQKIHQDEWSKYVRWWRAMGWSIPSLPSAASVTDKLTPPPPKPMVPVNGSQHLTAAFGNRLTATPIPTAVTTPSTTPSATPNAALETMTVGHTSFITRAIRTKTVERAAPPAQTPAA